MNAVLKKHWEGGSFLAAHNFLGMTFGYVFSKAEVQVVDLFREHIFGFFSDALEKVKDLGLPLECSVLRWSTVSCRISAFSSFADPCFSKADGTSRFSSVSDVLILSLRFFSMTPRRFLRLISWQLSFSMDEGLRGKEKKISLQDKKRKIFLRQHLLLLWRLFRINVIAITFRHRPLHSTCCGWCPCIIVVGRWIAVANWRRCQRSW